LGRRIIFHLPFHWIFLPLYILLATPIAYTLLLAPAYILEWIPHWCSGATALVWITMLLLSVSPFLGFVNIKIASKKKTMETLRYDYVVVWGIPVPVPRIDLIEHESVIAVNVGGALIPLFNSGVMVYLARCIPVNGVMASILLSVVVTTVYTFYSSKAVPGLGIVAPGLGIALVSLLTSVITLRQGPVFIPAYVGATVGSLLGADVIRLLKDKDKLRDALFLSIGGAGVFDGIYLSGAIAVALAVLAS